MGPCQPWYVPIDACRVEGDLEPPPLLPASLPFSQWKRLDDHAARVLAEARPAPTEDEPEALIADALEKCLK